MLLGLIRLSLLAAAACIMLAIAEQSAMTGAVSADGLAVTMSSVTTPIAVALRRRRGRPRKFGTPSRAVTLTLPESIIASLFKVDSDLSRAIVSLAKRGVPTNGRPPAELAVFGRRAVITIRPTPSLERRAGIDLVPLPDGRALISFDQPKTIAELELTLGDALDDPRLGGDDRKVFEGISEILKEARRSHEVALLRRTIIVLESIDTRKQANAKRQRQSKA